MLDFILENSIIFVYAKLVLSHSSCWTCFFTVYTAMPLVVLFSTWTYCLPGIVCVFCLLYVLVMICSIYYWKYHVNFIWLKCDAYEKEVAYPWMFVIVHVYKACTICVLTFEHCMIYQWTSDLLVFWLLKGTDPWFD